MNSSRTMMTTFISWNESNNSTRNLIKGGRGDENWPILIVSFSMLLLCTLGIYGNMICALIYSRVVMHSPINNLLVGLSVIDAVILLLCIPSFIIPGLDQYRTIPSWDKIYPIVVRFVYPILMSAQTSSIWTFVLISIERFTAVCRPFNAFRTIDSRKANLALISIILASFAYNAIRFWEYQYSPQYPWMEKLLRINEYYFMIYVTGFYFTFNFLIPFMIISILNFQIIRSIQMACRQHAVIRSSQRQEYKTTWMMLVVTIMFASCNTPAFVLNIWEACEPDMFEKHEMIAFLVTDLSNCLIVINSSSTILIYVIFCKRFWLLFKYYHSAQFLRNEHMSMVDVKKSVSEDCSMSSTGLLKDHSRKLLKGTDFKETVKSL